jgi:quercetin dioxygenase-like cupin family protein
VELVTKVPTTKGPAELFTGDVWFDVIARGDEESRMRVNAVRFSPCARTAWHSHSLARYGLRPGRPVLRPRGWLCRRPRE